MISYFLQLLVFQVLFLAAYELFLKKETFFSLNRAYLLITPFLAAILPFLEIEFLREAVPVEGFVQLPIVFLSEGNAANPSTFSETLRENISSQNAMQWWLWPYAGGILISLLLFLKKHAQLRRIKKTGRLEKLGKINIVHIPNSRSAFTFFNTVYLGGDLLAEEREQILSHELVHVEEKHSYDLLLFESLRIVLWFSPFIYRYQSQLSMLHEYIADAKTSRKLTKKVYFQELLNAAFGTRKISFCNSFFNKSLIKKRILMLQKPRSPRNAKLKYLLIFPLILAMMTYVACSTDNAGNQPGSISSEMGDGEKVKTFQVESFQSITEEKENEITQYIQQIGSQYNKVVVTAGKTSLIFNKSKGYENGFLSVNSEGKLEYKADEVQFNSDPPPSPPSPPSPFDMDVIPFAAVDKVPVFPECENLADKEASKKCVATKITEIVSDNFNTKLGKELGLSGIQRIKVMFKINQSGEVVEIEAKGPHPKLEQEAVRIIGMLPLMKPGEQEGRKVSVLYSLPIIFKIQ